MGGSGFEASISRHGLRWVLVAFALFAAFAIVYSVHSSADAMVSSSGSSSSAGGGKKAASPPPPPIARNDRFTLTEDKVLRAGGRGVLRNDRGTKLTALRNANPKNGKLTLRKNGSFTYKPKANFNGRDTFSYRAKDDRGRVNRGVATIVVAPVNDAPSFTVGPDQTVDEDAGIQSVPGWAKNIRKGPANESRQTPTFEITGNTNQDLFSEEPSVSPDGTLSFESAPNANGEAIINLLLRDNGGTARGGKNTSAERTFTITVEDVNDAPEVTAANNGPIDEGASATITATATDEENDPLTYSFDCDDDGTFEVGPQSGNTTDCDFDDSGERNVDVEVSDSEPKTGTASTTVTVNNVAPTGTLRDSGDIDEGGSVEVSFEDENGRSTVTDPSAADTNAGFGYEFACDGTLDENPDYETASTDPFASCRFAQDGEKTIAARVIDKDGGSSEYTTTVTVANVRQTVSLEGPSTVAESVTEKRQYTFTITDPGADTFEVVTPGFPSCGSNGELVDANGAEDGGTFAYDSEARTGSFECVFPDGPASSDVTIRVSDQDGVTDTDDQPVKVTASVENEAPSATFNAPASVDEGDDIEISLTEATDPAGDNDTIEYRFKCGDAAWSEYGTTATATCPTTDDGNIVVKGQVRDEDGGESEEYEETVTVSNVNPSVTAPADAQTADEGVLESFGLGSFTDPGLDDGPWNVTVEWGDGSQNDTFAVNAPGSLGNLDHTYPDGDDTYTATVTVTEAGTSAPSGSDTFDVDVDNVPPTANAQNVSSNEGERKEISLTGDDVAADKPLSFVITSLPASGTLFDGETEITAGDLPFTLAGNDVAYEPPDATFTGDVSFGFRANDGEDDSDEATVSIKVEQINEAPTATDDDGYEVAEDGTLTFAASELTENDSPGTNEDSQTLTVISVDNAENGSVSLDDKGTSDAGDDEITFAPTTDYFGAASFEYTVEDDGETAGQPDPLTDAGSVSATVTEVNDAPTANDDPAQNATYEISEDSETALSVTAANGLLANDSKGPANESGQTLAVSDSDPNAEGTQPESGPDHGSLELEADGSFEYTPTENNFNGTDSFTYEVCDDGTTDGNPDPKCDTATATITVTAMNDAPVLTLAESLTVREDEPTPLSGISAEDVDAGSNDVTLSLSVDSGTLSATDGGEVSVSGSGTDSLTLTGSVANINAFIENVEFTTAQDATEDVSLDVEINDNGHTGGAAETDSGTITINVTPVNDAPTATLDEYSGAIGNTKFAVGVSNPSGPVVSKSGTVLDNDSDGVEDDELSATEETITTENDGTVNMNSNGTFTYVSAPGFTGDDSFTYEVCDDGETEGQPDPKCAEGTADVGVENVVWYVKNDSSAGGLGRSTDPFDTLAEAQNASDANETIFVYRGNDTVAGQNSGISLKNGQRLLGEHAGLSVGGTKLLDANLGTHPTIGNPGGDGVTVSANATNGNRTGVEIRGFRISASTNAIDVTSAGAANLGVSISDNIVTGAGSEGVDVNAGSTGTQNMEIHDNLLAANGNALDVNRTAGTATITRFDDNLVSNASPGSGIVANAVTFDAVPGGSIQTVSGGTTRIGLPSGVGGAGMILTGNTVGDLSFDDLEVHAKNGAGLRIEGAGQFNGSTGTRLSVATSGAANISAAGGPALDASSATVNLPLGTLTNSNSPTNGISLSGVGGSFSAGSGSEITNASNADVSIQNSTATFDYAGTITDDTGRLVSVTNNSTGTHGAKTFSGKITDGDDGDGEGILLDNNDNATVNFTGGLTLSTGNNAAFTAANGGTVNVSQNNTSIVNSISTTTGTALNVSNTNIGSTGMVFRSISANGAPNGIVLNGTGSSGGLTVAGNSASNSGGTIQNTTSDGVSLTNTRNPSFTNVLIRDTGRHGIFGTGVSGFTFSGGRIEGAGDGNGEDGISFATLGSNNLSGTALVRNSTIIGSSENNMHVDNTGGSLDLTVDDSDFTNTLAGDFGEDGVLVNANGTAQTKVRVHNGSTFSGLDSVGVGGYSSGNSTLDITVEGSTFTGTKNSGGASASLENASDNAVEFTSVDQSTLRFAVKNNTMTNHPNTAIDLGSNQTSSFHGDISGNSIGQNGVAESGSQKANGIALFADDDSTAVVSMDNNEIHGVENSGIDVFVNEGLNASATPEAHVSITNNTVSTPRDTFKIEYNSIAMQAQNNGAICANAQNNTAASGSGPHYGADSNFSKAIHAVMFADGSNIPNATPRFRIERLNGGSGNVSNEATVASHLASENPASASTAASLDPPSLAFAGVPSGTCQTPTAPSLP